MNDDLWEWIREAGFEDRRDAGLQLAERLAPLRTDDPIVLGLPRGGVPVAAEIARALAAPLDVVVSRKIGAPGQSELAIGAVAPGVQFIEPYYIQVFGLSEPDQERLAARAREEMEARIRRFRGEDGLPDVKDKTAILVDDGIATGATALAAIRAVRKEKPRRIVVGAGVCPPETAERLREEADEVVCILEPEPFGAVGLWFRHFEQVTDDEVLALLEQARRSRREVVPAAQL
jgi:putative phosphoribosyl transferase